MRELTCGQGDKSWFKLRMFRITSSVACVTLRLLRGGIFKDGDPHHFTKVFDAICLKYNILDEGSSATSTGAAQVYTEDELRGRTSGFAAIFLFLAEVHLFHNYQILL